MKNRTSVTESHQIYHMIVIIIACRVFFGIYAFRNHRINAEFFLYVNAFLPVIMGACVIYAIVVLIINYKIMDRSGKIFLIVYSLFLVMFCPVKESMMSARDLMQGVRSIDTEYYTINSKLYVYDEHVGADISPIINKVQLDYIQDNCPEINHQKTVNVAGWGEIPAHTQSICLELYPETLLVSRVYYQDGKELKLPDD